MRAIYSVVVAGNDVTSRFAARLQHISVMDKSGQTSDTATITLDDRDGLLVLPEPGAPVEIVLGWEGRGSGVVFSGVVDDIRATGGRSGRELHITAKGMDTRGPAKEPMRMHLDDVTVEEAMKKIGKRVGLEVKVDGSLAKLVRRYIALDDESFAAFGERLAKEVGGTFKIAGGKAILARRNGGESASGKPLPTVRAAWGENLHTYDIAPILGRNAEKATAVRYYDREAAAWRIIEAATGTRNATTRRVALTHASDEDTAKAQAKADAAEADRKSGEGSIVIEGNIEAQPEGLCQVANCRPGIDGVYRIESVTHEYSRSGFTTILELKQPQGTAGKDSRGSPPPTGLVRYFDGESREWRTVPAQDAPPGVQTRPLR